MSEARDRQAEIRQIAFFRSAIPPELCAKWVDSTLDPAEFNDGRVGSDSPAGTVDRSQRDVKVIRSVFHGEIRDWVKQIGHQLIAPFYKIEIIGFEEPDILRYESGGHYLVHADSDVLDKDGNWCRARERDYSLVVFLNTDFTGGGFDLPNQDLHIEPTEPGVAIAFPSDRRFLHAVQPVEAGLRFTLVTWFRARKV